MLLSQIRSKQTLLAIGLTQTGSVILVQEIILVHSIKNHFSFENTVYTINSGHA